MGYILYIIFIIICFIAGWNMLGTILLIVAVLFVAIGYSNDKKNEEKKRERAKRNEELRVQREEELNNVIIPAYEKSRNELIEKYGNPAKAFTLEQYNLDKEIIAFENSKRIWICGKDFPMKSILSCTFVDDKKIVKGQIISTTKTNNKDMVKRAVVGDVLLGSTGAIIGGSTASKSTISTQENDKVYHDYTVIINVDSLSEPILRINLGSDGQTTNEVVGLMNVIVSRNKNPL